GTTPEVAMGALAAAGVDVLGVNCGAGPTACLEAARRMDGSGGASETGLLRSVMPNAGLPRRVEGRFVYAADPAYFASMAVEAAHAGLDVIGGCCGTTPAHIAAMRQ